MVSFDMSLSRVVYFDEKKSWAMVDENTVSEKSLFVLLQNARMVTNTSLEM